MQKHNPIFKRKQLVIAVSMAMLGGALTGCSSSSSSSAPAPGTATIVANGGTAGNMPGANGGQGGYISLYNWAGTGGVEVRKTGAANTDFTTPKEITNDAGSVDLGDNPLEVIANLILQVVDAENPVADGGITVADEPYLDTEDVIRVAAGATAVYASDPVLAAGTPYLRQVFSDAIPRIYKSSGADIAGDTVVTGLSVAEGVTLTLGNNMGCDAAAAFSNGIDNSGTITKVIDLGSEGCQLALGANKYLASGSIVNAGSEDFEDGGDVLITTATGINNSGPINASGFDEDNDVNGDEPGGDGGSIYLAAGGYILNSGTLHGSGGDGKGAGGDGGYVNMYGAYTESTGDIDISGGNNVSDPLALLFGNGGDGGEVGLGADYVTNNTANIDTHGGDGSNGGQGGSINMSNDLLGEVKNAGNLVMHGGTGVEGSGGSGGQLYMMAYGGNVLNSGNLNSAGGNSTDATSSGGQGGQVQFNSYSGDGDEPAGDIVISGDINSSGGSAVADGSGNGGSAGSIYASVYQSESEDTFKQRVSLLGYASIDANGGDGASAGSAYGSGSSTSVYIHADGAENYLSKWHAGSVANDVPINARGGNGTTADPEVPVANYGGIGGGVNISASTSDAVKALNVRATNTADIDVSGGNAVGDESIASDGGEGGFFRLSAYAGATNSGAVNGSGGNGGFSGGDAGNSVDIYAVSGAVNNSGAVDNSGGDGGVDGGHGGDVELFGASSVNSADVNVNGGNATSTDELVDTTGGDGGYVGILALGLNAKTTNTGTVTYSFGTGDTNGEEGCLQVGLTFEGTCLFDPTDMLP